MSTKLLNKHFLNSWSGKNEKIRGIIIENTGEEEFEQIALAMFVLYSIVKLKSRLNG